MKARARRSGGRRPAGPGRRGRGRAALLAVLVLALSACRLPPPDLGAVPAELLGAVRARQERFRRVSGSAWLTIEGPGPGPGGGSGPRGGLPALAAAEKPDRLRVDLLDFFGSPALSLAVAGDRFVLFDGRRGRWIRGPATPEVLGRLLPGAPPVEELVAALCGSALLLEGAALADPGGGPGRLRLGAGAREQVLEVGPGAALLAARTARRRDQGSAESEGRELRFGLFRGTGPARFPAEIRLADGAGRSLTVRWGEDLAVNGPADPTLFALAPPPGARVEEWTGGAGEELELPLRAPE